MKARNVFFFTPLFLFFMTTIASYAGNTILLKDAESAKQVELVIRGISKDAGKHATGTHFGECIEFDVINLTNSVLEIKVELGRKLICDYDSIQNMMLTRELIFTLNAREKAKYRTYAMCIEQQDASPNAKSTFHLGEMAETNLLELAKTLDKNNYQNSCGQSAVWTIINNSDTSSIWGTNAEEKKFLRKYVSSLRGDNIKKIDNTPEQTIFIESKEFNISGSIEWNMKKKGAASLIVYDEQGNYITSIFKDKKFETGQQTYNFQLVSCLLKPDTKYLVRLKVNNLTQKELVLNTE
ncbi:MAG: hypothetical protein V1904_06605 [Bacteroidota bacterium]